MAKKTYKPFPAVNCERIRNLQKVITKAEKEREDAFAARDHALEQIHSCGAAETEKKRRLREDHSIAVCNLDGLAKTIKWARKELANTIDEADNEGLFTDPTVEVPDWDAEDRADEADEADELPVGEPDGPSDPESDGAKATERMDAEEAFCPGKWEIQEVGKRGRGPTVEIESVEKLYAEADARLGSEVPFTVKLEGETGEVLAGGKAVLRLKRRGDFETVPDKPSRRSPKPGWRQSA